MQNSFLLQVFSSWKGFFAPVAVLDNDLIFLYNTLNAWGILRDTEDIFS